MPQKGNKGDTKMLNTHTLPFSILLKHLRGYCLMSGYIFECI